MPDCPECGTDILFLRNECMVSAIYNLEIDREGYAEYSYRDTDYGISENEGYFCPICDTLLFTDERDATAFLKGEKIEKEEKCPMLRRKKHDGL